MRKKILSGLLLGLCSSSALAQVFADPLDTPARQMVSPQNRPLLASSQHQPDIIAVGPRGLVVQISDQGIKQLPVPASSDLTSIYFTDPQHGWLAGHDGLILHTRDGGTSWHKQLDGNSALQQFRDFYTHFEHDNREHWLAETELNLGQGATLPFLDIHFLDQQQGFAVGAFGLNAVTQDGGQHWQPFLHGLDNPRGLHLNGITEHQGLLVIAAESGSLFIGDPKQLPLPHIQTPYAGSFFGAISFDNTLYAYGMRGNLWRSADLQQWQAEPVNARGSFSAAAADDNLLVLATSAGEVFWKTSDSSTFAALPVAPAPFAAISLTEREVLLFGLRGLVRVARPDLTDTAGTP